MSQPGRSRKLIDVVSRGIQCCCFWVSCSGRHRCEELPDVTLGTPDKQKKDLGYRHKYVIQKCWKWSPISNFQQGYLKNYWVLEKYNRIFVFLAQRHYKSSENDFGSCSTSQNCLEHVLCQKKKAIYVKMSDAVNNFALQIHTENNQQLSL